MRSARRRWRFYCAWRGAANIRVRSTGCSGWSWWSGNPVWSGASRREQWRGDRIAAAVAHDRAGVFRHCDPQLFRSPVVRGGVGGAAILYGAGRPGVSSGEVTASPLRWRMIGLAFFATAINYLDRQTLSVGAPILREPVHISKTSEE